MIMVIYGQEEYDGTAYIGGLVGDCRTNVSNSYNIGNIEATSDNLHVGGILAEYGSNILNCYNTGDIHLNGYSNIEVGGISRRRRNYFTLL